MTFYIVLYTNVLQAQDLYDRLSLVRNKLTEETLVKWMTSGQAKSVGKCT